MDTNLLLLAWMLSLVTDRNYNDCKGNVENAKTALIVFSFWPAL